MSTASSSVADIHASIQEDVGASEEIQKRIDELQAVIDAGKTIPDVHALFETETQGRKMLKDLTNRIEKIADLPNLDKADREMLQALNRRQVVCDRQVMQLAELHSLHLQARGLSYSNDGDFLSTATEPAPKVQANSKTSPGATAELGTGTSTEVEVKPTSSSKPSMGSVQDPVSGRMASAPSGGPQIAGYNQSVEDEKHEFEGETVEQEEELQEEEDLDEEDLEPDKSTWPICYRILDVSPATEKHCFEETCKRAYRKLSLKHDPKRMPNDPDAPARWASIMKAYETLTDPGRKMFYDQHGRTPAALVDFDMERLNVSNERHGGVRQNVGSVVQVEDVSEGDDEAT